jgi:hypothetical protein
MNPKLLSGQRSMTRTPARIYAFIAGVIAVPLKIVFTWPDFGVEHGEMSDVRYSVIIGLARQRE